MPQVNPNIAILEIRAGPGGDEAKLWAEDLANMYTRYANKIGWKVSQVDQGVIKIKGFDCYHQLKFETGTHRVQRVPRTEKRGRIHTSTATVVVLPQINSQEIKINNVDLEFAAFRAGGAGGQNVNKVSTAVRIKHIPSNISIVSSQERSQQQNREIALDILRSKLWKIEEEKKLQKEGKLRTSVGQGMRADKIRTYNFAQNRITDHRLKKSWHKLDKMIQGNIEDLILELTTLDEPKKN